MEDKITIGFCGDVMLGRKVDEMIGQAGYYYPWGNMLPIMQQTDFNIANLETALTTSHHRVRKTFNFKAAPDRVATLKAGNIHAVNLANNHILDFSVSGLTDTIHALQEADIKYVGAGRSRAEARQPAFITYRGSRIGLLGFTDNEPGWRAGLSAGTNYLDPFDTRDRLHALLAVEQLAREADLAIVSIHWGPNMRDKPDPAFVSLAHEMVEAGADIIHGHSAHIFQGIEVYHDKLILYDTGDYVDDYVTDVFLRNDHSFFFMAEASGKEVIRLQLVPVVISNCQVNMAPAADSSRAIRRIQRLSRPWQTDISPEGEIVLKKTGALNEL